MRANIGKSSVFVRFAKLQKKKKNDKKVRGNDENWCGKWGKFGLQDCDERFFAIMAIL